MNDDVTRTGRGRPGVRAMTGFSKQCVGVMDLNQKLVRFRRPVSGNKSDSWVPKPKPNQTNRNRQLLVTKPDDHGVL